MKNRFFTEEINRVPKHLKGVLRHLIFVLKEFFGEKLYSVVLYGSIARGDWRKSSDIDLIIVVEDLPSSRLERQRIFMEVEKLLEDDLDSLNNMNYYHDFSPILKTPSEAKRFSPLYLELIEDAIILYDKENFI